MPTGRKSPSVQDWNETAVEYVLNDTILNFIENTVKDSVSQNRVGCQSIFSGSILTP